MKIAQIVCAYPPYSGGMGTSAKKLQDILQEEHDSFVFTIKRKGEVSEDKVIRLKSFLRLGNGAVLFKLFKELKKFDLIYLHIPFFGSSLIVYLFKLFNKDKKLIVHYHMDVRQENIIFKILSLPGEMLKFPLLRQADKIFCASIDHTRNSKIKNYYKKHPEKFIETPFFVNQKDFYPDKERKKNKDKKQILFVGGLDKAHYFKGLDLLIRSFSKAEIENTELIICGDGDLRDSYQKLAKGLDVVFKGNLDHGQLKYLYQSADVLVLPSICNESFGIVLIEAMASKTTVIASSLPGVRSVFEDQKSGLLVKVNDEEDLREKIETIINNDKLRQNLEENAYKLFLEKYEEGVVKKKILENI